MTDNKNHIAPTEVVAAIAYFDREFKEGGRSRRHFYVLVDRIIDLRVKLLSAEHKLADTDIHEDYRETEDCPVCVEVHGKDADSGIWTVSKPGPCWRCHGERRVII